MKTYTLFVEGEDAVDYGTKKTAVKYGDSSGKTYQIQSPSGAVVYAVQVPEYELDEDGVTPKEVDTEGDVWVPELDPTHVPTEDPSDVDAGSSQTPASDPKSDEKCDLLADLPKPKKPADISKMKKRINALLAKAESSDFPAERDAFNAGAEKLMLRLGISIAELEAEGKVKTEKIIEVKRTFPGNYSISMIPFVTYIAKGFGHITILQNKTAGLARNAFIIGHESDVEQFIVLLDSLSLQVMSALRIWQKENKDARRGLTDMQKYLQHRSFIEGFGLQVGERLEARRTTEEVGISTGTALVLASKESRVQDWVSEQYPVLGKGRSGRGYSSVGFYAGKTSGATANLNDPALKGKSGEINA